MTSRLFSCKDFILLPQLQDKTYFPVDIAIKTLLFGRIFVKFEKYIVGDQILRFCAELVDLLRLTSLCFWFSNSSINFLTLFSRDFLLLDCRKKYSEHNVIHGVVTDFPVIFRIA